MTFISALKELWTRRLLVSLVVVIAVAAAVVAVYQVSISPPSLSKRSSAQAHGSSEILVDSAQSPIAGSRRHLEGLVTRAGVFSRLMAGGDIVDQIATEAGVPTDQVGVVGPEPLPGEAPGISEAPAALPYELSFTQEPELPIVSITTRAPTVAEARALAVAAPVALKGLVKSVQQRQDTPAPERIEVRVLGPAQARLVDEGPGGKIGAAVFVVVLALGLGLILGVPRLVKAWRESDEEEAELADVADISEAGTSLLIPNATQAAKPSGESGGKAHEEHTRRIRQRQGS